MIRYNNVSVTKDQKDILKDISVTFTENRIGIVGQNGSGKSTFVKLLNGLEQCSSGNIEVQDTHETSKNKTRKKVGFVFQNPDNQIVFSLVEDDIAYGLKKSGLTKQEIRTRVENTLKSFGLEHLYGRFTHELSGGEKQLIALIGVLIMEPSIIVLDEPTTLLDLKNRALLLKTLERLPQSLIIVSHDLDYMQQMDRLVLFHDGCIIEDGNPDNVLKIYRNMSQC